MHRFIETMRAMFDLVGRQDPDGPPPTVVTVVSTRADAERLYESTLEMLGDEKNERFNPDLTWDSVPETSREQEIENLRRLGELPPELPARPVVHPDDAHLWEGSE